MSTAAQLSRCVTCKRWRRAFTLSRNPLSPITFCQATRKSVKCSADALTGDKHTQRRLFQVGMNDGRSGSVSRFCANVTMCVSPVGCETSTTLCVCRRSSIEQIPGCFASLVISGCVGEFIDARFFFFSDDVICTSLRRAQPVIAEGRCLVLN